jgi:hypothetical protein
MNRAVFVSAPLFAVLIAGCAHSHPAPAALATAELTSATAQAPVAPSAPAAPAVATEEPAPAAEEAPAPAKKKTENAPMSFEALSSALGSDDKMGLDIDHPATAAPTGKAFQAEGYAAVGAVHQQASDNVKHGGEVQVSGGLTVPQVRGVVRENASRLRVCYERGLKADPRLAGRVTVSFSVDAQGAVQDVEAQSETLPGEVTSCVANIFETITFAAPKASPAKVTLPVDFNKDS